MIHHRPEVATVAEEPNVRRRNGSHIHEAIPHLMDAMLGRLPDRGCSGTKPSRPGSKWLDQIRSDNIVVPIYV